MSNYFRVLRENPDFARLWLAQAVSLLGDWFDTIVLSALVSKYSGGNGLAISAFLLARFLPPLLVSPAAGVLLDRLDRKRLLILCDVLRVGIVLALLLADRPERLWLIYALTILQFSLSAIFEPGRSAFLPSVVKRDDLVVANIISSVTWSVMLAAGGALGGLVAATLGTAAALVMDSASFAISAILIAQIKSAAAPGDQETLERKPPSIHDFTEGLRYARQHPGLAATLMVKFGGSLGSLDTLMIIYATSLFASGQDGSASLGILWSAFGIGAVLGPLWMNRLSDGSVQVMRRFIIVAFAFITVGWVIFGGAPVLWIAALALMVKAMGSSVYWTYSSVILQKTIPDDYLGRFFSLDMAGFQLSMVLSTVITGALLQFLGNSEVRTIVFGTALVSLIPLAGWTQIVRWIERRELASAVGD